MTGITTTKILLAIALLALALTGCSSDSNTTAPNVYVDEAPPAEPTYLSGFSHEDGVVVQWAANTTDADLLGYNVYRVIGSRVVLLNDAPVQTTNYLDQRTASGPHTYRVTAVDHSGNESAYQTVTVEVFSEPNTYHPDNGFEGIWPGLEF